MTGCRELRLDNQNREEGAPDVWPSTWMSRHDLARKAEICLQCGSRIILQDRRWMLGVRQLTIFYGIVKSQCGKSMNRYWEMTIVL